MSLTGIMNTVINMLHGADASIDPASIRFELHVQLSQFLIPAVSSGILFMGFIVFSYMYLRSRESLHLSMSAMAFMAAFFVFSEVMTLTVGGLFLDWETAIRFHHSEQVFAALFLFGVPFLLSNLLRLNAGWTRFNRIASWVGLAAAGFFIVVSFVAPDLYVSQTIHRPDWLIDAADFGRGQEGSLYAVRDALLGIVILYALVCFIADMVWHRTYRYQMPAVIGLLLAIHGAVVDILSVHTNAVYDIFPESRHSRFVLGITFFVLFSMGSVFRRFFDMGLEVERSRETARREAEKNIRQNTFIRDVLSSGAEDLVRDMEALSGTIAAFTGDSQEESAATEEVSAAIEEITAGVDSVKSGADEQYKSIVSLSSAMEGLSASITAMNTIVGQTLEAMGMISDNAKSGEQSLQVMNDSMKNISGSSSEITGIVQIINDISDRINLLSLNAAIEAARAGDAGRGFAVVADEISKLADQTATSIKNIDDLIRTNERDIAQGIGNIKDAVDKIDAIIAGIEGIVDKIREIPARMNEQAETNRVVTENARLVTMKSQEITNAMTEQRNAMDEISKTVSSINQLSQGNTHKIMDITGFAKSLVGKVERLNGEIEKAGEDDTAL